MITIEQVEQLANDLETEEAAQRAKLERLIKAEARIIWAREPEKFKRMPLEYGDENGHFDSSFPPKQVYRDRSGPRLIEVRDCTTKDLATSGGFYYSWRRVTEHPGLFVSRDGRILGAEETGTGRVGQFAAHPGDCDVEVTIEYSERYSDEITLAELREVEAELRALAFPTSQAVAS